MDPSVVGLLQHQRFDGTFSASDPLCKAVTCKPLGDVMQQLRSLHELKGLSDDQIMSVVVAAFFEKHFGADLDVWEAAVARVGDVVLGYTEKVQVVLISGVLA